MSLELAVKNPGGMRVLVAPLDWGLGHATRCIPVIYELIKQGTDVWIAGEGAMVILLKKEFPKLPFLHLPGYQIKYHHSPLELVLSILRQIPSILRSIRREHHWLKDAVAKYDFDAIISDNRFGLYHSSVPSVFITHQLRIMTPFGNMLTNSLQKLNYRFINRFNQCWVPDTPGNNGLAGDLSHPEKLPAIPVHYTGLLSRLSAVNTPVKKGHLLISISGPEPQRSILEDKILSGIAHYNGTASIVRGLPDESRIIPSTNDIQVHNHLTAEEYGQEMAAAEWVICRSGYSTVMDLVKMGKKAVLIPTPGQTEQEYLGKWLDKSQLAACLPQKNFSLPKALELAQTYNYRSMPVEETLSDLINDFLQSLNNKRSVINGIHNTGL